MPAFGPLRPKGTRRVLLGVLLALPPCANACPTDPTWISGFYDDNDYDDVILFITGAVTAVSQNPAPIWLVTVCLGLIAPAGRRSSRPGRAGFSPPELLLTGPGNTVRRPRSYSGGRVSPQLEIRLVAEPKQEVSQ